MINWMAIALMIAMFVNACICGGLIVLIIQLAQLLNPNLYRRQVVSNKIKETKPTGGGNVKIRPNELLKDMVETEPNKVLKKFIESA